MERLDLDPTTPWWGEHRARYRFAFPFARGGCVLDVACGSGFGAAMLGAAGAATVIGADLVAAAPIRERSNTLRFIRADALTLPFTGACFDVAVSFETIEHLPQPERFVAEMRRVLRANGVLILSTPNALVTARYPRNPFHLREFAPAELRELLARHFDRIDLFGQTPRAGFGVLPFLPGHERAGDLAGHCQAIIWKLLRRLAPRLRERAAQLLWRRAFYPTEWDYVFDAAAVESAHVVVAVCGT